MAIQTTSLSRSLSVEITVVDTQDGRLSTNFVIDTFRTLDEDYLNSRLTIYALSNRTLTKILMLISFYTSLHLFGQKTKGSLITVFSDFSKVNGRQVTVELRH